MENLKKKFVAVENAVVDLQYHRGHGDEALQKAFFKTLKENIEAAGLKPSFGENPRAGDALLIGAEDFDAACLEFGKAQGLMKDVVALTDAGKASAVRDIVFGAHDSVSGGSFANTFHTMQKSKINGRPVIEGTFVTCVGEDAYGDIFYNDLEGHIKAKKEGRQMVCHVFPVESDRILIATPAAVNPAEGNITADLFDGLIDEKTDRVGIGGFLFFTGRYGEVMDKVLADIQAVKADKRPDLVMTAASQAVAASPDFRAEFNKAAKAVSLTVHANTGEFRRLLDMDTEWRKPYNPAFEGLKGHDLEEAKEAHGTYQAAKQEANRVALEAAMTLIKEVKQQYGHDLKFVVTNGSKGIFTAALETGVQTYKPEKIKKEQISNTVGAGDNFAAGYQLGDLFGLSDEQSVRMGAEMAASVIQIPEARLDDHKSKTIGSTAKVSGGLAYLKASTVQPLLPKIR
jgi:sugar/nucleoside kinase (ribokinase family)